VDVPPVNLPPVTRGAAAHFSSVTYMRIQPSNGANQSVVEFDNDHDYVLTLWLKPDLDELSAGFGNESVVLVMNVPCRDHNSTCELEALSLIFSRDGDLILRVPSHTLVPSGDTSLPVEEPFLADLADFLLIPVAKLETWGPGESVWNKIGIVLSPGKHTICVSVNGTTPDCTPVHMDFETFPSLVLGAQLRDVLNRLHRCSSAPTTKRTCDHYHGAMDDVGVFAVDTTGATERTVPWLLHPHTYINWNDPTLSLDPAVHPMMMLTFDSPLSMMWQPPVVSSAQPEAFNYQQTIALPRVDFATLLKYRQLEVDMEHNRSSSSSSGKPVSWQPTVYVVEDATAAVLPRLVSSNAPMFGVYHGVENTSIVLELPGFDTENQLLTAKIVEFPARGVLYQVNADGSRGDPIPRSPTIASETQITQYAAEVLTVTREWATTEAHLEYLGVTLDDVLSGKIPQSDFADCYCALGALGKPDCDALNVDCSTTWNIESGIGRQSIDVRFATAVRVSQVEVFLPQGGQTLVEILALSPLESWITIFLANKRQVDVTNSSSAPLEYVDFFADPCRTTFLTDTIRLVFDTDLTQQWLGVRAQFLLFLLG
jgi:hypothetical protein